MNKVVVRLVSRGETEYAEISGDLAVVERLVHPYLTGQRFTVDGPAISTSRDKLTLDQNVSLSGQIIEPVQDHVDLPTFYRKMAPKDQYEQLLTIAYHLQVNCCKEVITQTDLVSAYRELRRIPVKPPKNMNSTVQNLVKRREWIRSLDPGRYIVTDKGRSVAEARLRG